MRLCRFLWVIAFVIVAEANNAHAQLIDSAISNSLGAATELGVAARPPVDPAMIMQNLQKQGYTNIAASPSDPDQYTATAPGGINVAIIVNRVTGQVVSAVPR